MTAPQASETPETPATATETPAEAPKQPETGQTGGETKSDADTIAELQAKVAQLSQENGKQRLNAKKQAADEARTELLQQIAQAIGAEPDGKPDPERLTADLATQTRENASLRAENAVFRLAGSLEANPAALLDSVTFVKSLEGIDPNDGAAVSAAITAAVAANPALKVTATRRVPGPNPAQGTSQAGAPSPEQAASAAERDGDFRTAGRIKAAQLLDLSKNTR